MPALAPPLTAGPRPDVDDQVRALSNGFNGRGETLASEIESSGVACLEGAVRGDWLSEARRYVESEFPMDGTHELMVHRSGTGHDMFAELVCEPRIQALLKSVATAAVPSLRLGDRDVEAVLRLVSGPPPVSKPLGFHYDGSVVTMVIPILIPDTEPGQRGELVLCPNRRPFRRSALTNVAEKFVTQNDMYRRRFVRRQARRSDLKMVDVRPGNAYFFWGYRSYHGNLRCPSNTLRATLLVHYGRIHRDSALLAHTMSLGRMLRNVNRTITAGSGSYRILADTN